MLLYEKKDIFYQILSQPQFRRRGVTVKEFSRILYFTQGMGWIKNVLQELVKDGLVRAIKVGGYTLYKVV